MWASASAVPGNADFHVFSHVSHAPDPVRGRQDSWKDPLQLKVPEVSHSASGTVYVNGRVRGRVSGVVDAHIQGVIYGDVSGMLETGSYQTKEVPKADETEKQ